MSDIGPIHYTIDCSQALRDRFMPDVVAGGKVVGSTSPSRISIEQLLEIEQMLENGIGLYDRRLEGKPAYAFRKRGSVTSSVTLSRARMTFMSKVTSSGFPPI